MMEILIVLVLVVLAVIAAVVFGGVKLARSSKSAFTAANEVVPGVPTRAPAHWAGSHSPEARLHRRLRDAVTAMRSNPALEGPAFSEARALVESEALAVDDRLVAVAALPAHQRGDRLAAVTEAVRQIEKVVAEMVDAGLSTSDTGAALDAVRTRLELVAQARDELSALGTDSQLQELRDFIASEAPDTAAVDAGTPDTGAEPDGPKSAPGTADSDGDDTGLASP